MSEERKVGFVVAAENQTKQTFEDIKRDGQAMAKSVGKAGEDAARGIAKIGETGEEAAQKLGRGESSMMGMLKRVSEQAQITARAGESLADAFDIKIENRGFDASKFAPMLAGLRDYESAISVAKAREMEFAAQNAFAAKAAQAQEMAKASQYASWWAEELKKVDAAERKLASENSFINSLRAQSEAIGKTRADLLELQAAQLGLGSQAAPYIAKLRESEGAMGAAGKSAKELQFALRGVPAQISDIVVSLQGGMPIMTVFMQQGLQLRDMFGGFAEAGKALASTVLGMINPLTVAGAAAAAFGVAYYQGGKEVDALRMAIVTTGNMAGASVTQLRQFAAEMGSISGAEAKASSALADFVAAGVRGTETLKEYAQTAIDWERATGTAVEKTAKAFAKLQDDPLKAALELHKGMNFLTLATYAHASALEEQGKKSEAAALLQREYAKALNQGTAEIRTNLGFLESTWEKLGKTASAVWGLMLGAGRSATLADKLAGVRDDIAGMERQLAQRSGFGNTGGGAATGSGTSRLTKQDIEALKERIRQRKEELAEMQKQGEKEKADAERRAAEGKAVEDRAKARDEFQNKYASNLKKELTLQQQLEQFRSDASKAGASSEEVRLGEQSIREEHLKKVASAAKAYNKELTEQQKLIAELSGLAPDFYQEWDRLSKSYARGALSLSQLEQAQAALLAKQPFSIALAKEEAAEQKKRIKAYEDEVKAQEKLLDQRQKAAEQVEDTLRKAQEEERAHALAAEAGITLAEAVAMIALARAEDNYQKALGAGADAETLLALQREIEARKELASVMQQRGVREANEKAQAQIAKDWEKMAQTAGDTLADYIMAGGKDAATYLKRLFSTLVLQPAVNAGVVGLISGASSAAGSTSGGSGMLGALQSGQSLWSAYSGGLTGALGTSLATMGATFGSTAATAFGSGIVAGGNLGLFGGGIGQGMALLGSGGAGSVASGLGTLAGAALPWIAGIAAIASIAKALDNGGTPHVGAGAVYDDGVLKGDKSTVNVNQAKNWSGTTQTGISSLASTLGGMFDGLAEAFGKETGWRVETGFSGDGDDKSRGLLSISDAGGKSIAAWGGKSGRYSSNVEKAWGQYLAEVSGSTLAALRDIAPDWGDAILDGATSELNKLSGTDKFEAIAQLAQQIAATKAQLLGLGDAMAMFKDMTDAVEGTLLSVSGGIDALVTNAGQFYDLYYSDAEKQARTMAQLQEVFTKYGAEVPATREEYRALVEAQMAAGESGAEFAAVLLGLSSQFAAISDTWAKELADMSSSASDFFSDLRESIASAQMDVAGSRKDILRGTGVMSADEIAAAIAGINTAGPSMGGLNAAGAANSAAAAAVAQAQSVRDAYAAAAGQQQSTLSGLQTQRSDAQAQIDAAKKNADDTYAWAMDQWLRRRGSHSYRKYTVTAMVEASQAAYAQTLQQMTGAISGLDAAIAQQQGVYDDAAAAAKVYADELAAAQAALAATQQAQVQAQVDYAAAMKDWVVEAGTSVTKLGELRGEVVDFYEAQAAAVQGMLQSAGNLRSVVDQVRLGQLDTAQTAAELGSRYATDYAMALATTGTTRAGYVDSMAGNLQSLSEALKAEAVTGAEWRIQTAKLLAQASNAAGLLEGDAEADDYQDVALGLLGSIDTALESLSAATVSAEQVIADAINAGTAAQLDGLRAIVAALKGDPIPAFAAGGYHAGGLRWVGENGPELEATGPSRIWNQSQLAGALGGGNSEVLVAEIRALREEQRAQAATIVRLQQDNNRLLMRWETQGLPTERNEV